MYHFSFVCDTGAPGGIYINSLTRRLIRDRIIDDDLGNQYIEIEEKKIVVKPSPSNHPDVNIIGLLGLLHFNFISFEFDNLPNYF